jgi:hypothetical protein
LTTIFKSFTNLDDTFMICPYCNVNLKSKNLKKHLRICVKKEQNTALLRESIKKSLRRSEVSRIKLAKEDFKDYQVQNTFQTYIHWSFVTFEKDKIVFIGDLKLLKPANLKGVHQGLNLIKKEYFERLYGKKIYKITYFNREVIPELSRDWELFTSTIETSIDYCSFTISKNNKKGKPLSKEQIFNFFFISPERAFY